MPPMILGAAGAVAKKLVGVGVGKLALGAAGTALATKFLKGTRVFDGDGNPFTVNVKPKRRKGLTYSEIRGAVKVLKLVKTFAPPGSRPRLRVKRS